jgi:hypothetical protein
MRDPDQVLSRELSLNAVRGFESTRGPRRLEVSEIEALVRCWWQGQSLSTVAAS